MYAILFVVYMYMMIICIEEDRLSNLNHISMHPLPSAPIRPNNARSSNRINNPCYNDSFVARMIVDNCANDVE